MLEFVSGDIFESRVQTLVNPVNCRGIMGKGLAKLFKLKFPEMYREYKELCDAGRLTPGELHLFRYPNTWILNFPTKDHWREKSKLAYIAAGLKTFQDRYRVWGITSIAFPRLGCDLGGLTWIDVKPVMVQYLEDLPILIQIYEDYVPNAGQQSLF